MTMYSDRISTIRTLPEDPEARDGDVLEGLDQLARVVVEVREHEAGLLGEVDLAEAEPFEALLPGLEDRRQVVAQRGHAGDEGRDRVREGARDHDQQQDRGAEQEPVDEHDGRDARQRGDVPDEEPDERAQDEREQPRQEEDEDDVAEEVEEVAQVAEHHEADDDHAEHEQRVQQTLLPFGQFQGHGVGTGLRTAFTDRPR